MKFLLTSCGISNDSIHKALVDMLGKPIAESSALCIPTAAYAFSGGAGMAWRLINGRAASPLCELVGSPWECWSSPRCPALIESFGSPWFRALMHCWWEREQSSVRGFRTPLRRWHRSRRRAGATPVRQGNRLHRIANRRASAHEVGGGTSGPDSLLRRDG